MNAFSIIPLELWQPILALTNISWSLLQSSQFPSTLCWTTRLVDRTWRMRAAHSLIEQVCSQCKTYYGYKASHERLLGMLPNHDLHQLLFELSPTLAHDKILEHFLEMPTSALTGQLGGHPMYTLCLLFQHAEAACPSASSLPHGYMFDGWYERDDEWAVPSPRQHWDLLDAYYYGGLAIDDPTCDPALLVVLSHLVTLDSPISSLPKFTTTKQIRQSVIQLVSRYNSAGHTFNRDLDYDLAQFVADHIVCPALSFMPTAIALPILDSTSPDILFALHTLVDFKFGPAIRYIIPWLSDTPPFWIWTAFRLTEDDTYEEMVESEMKRIAAKVGWEDGVLKVTRQVRIPYWSDEMQMRVRLYQEEAGGESKSECDSLLV